MRNMIQTIGENKFSELYPQAIFVDNWSDFEMLGTYIEIKDCFKRSGGRYVIFIDHHDLLVENGGWYFFVLKKKSPNGKGAPKIIACKWVPGCALEKYKILSRIRRSHLDDYEEKEVMDISWYKIWQSEYLRLNSPLQISST